MNILNCFLIRISHNSHKWNMFLNLIFLDFWEEIDFEGWQSLPRILPSSSDALLPTCNGGSNEWKIERIKRKENLPCVIFTCNERLDFILLRENFFFYLKTRDSAKNIPFGCKSTKITFFLTEIKKNLCDASVSTVELPWLIGSRK